MTVDFASGLPEGIYNGTVYVGGGGCQSRGGQAVVPVILNVTGCEDKDGDGFKAKSAICPEGNDCNDNPADGGGNIFPGATEMCDNRDNDCDGNIDEDIAPAACYTGPEGTLNVGGLCKEGTKTCTGGTWSGCTGEVLPAAEVCDGKDNDCDGQMDEDLSKECYTGPEGTKDVGLCKAGEQSCSAGQWGACTGDVLPATEVCDGEDGNCDGVKEDFTIEMSRSSIAPLKTSGSTTADVILELVNPPAESCTVKLRVEPEPKSGGHDHPHDATRPHGKLDGSDEKTVQLSGSAEKRVPYESSAIAGTENIKAEMIYNGEAVATKETKIDVKVPILGAMPDGPVEDDVKLWRLTGGTDEHADNHYVEASVMDAMMKIAKKYYITTATTLGINDMSLKWGGAFDIYGNWLEDTKKPYCNEKGHGHCSHRTGTDVDIDRKVYDPDAEKEIEIWCADDRNLKRIVKDNLGILQCETKGRKHIDFD